LFWLYPTLIAPLFNRFLPLQDEALRARIVDLLQRCGFASGGIFVMDGSKRSRHGNAYFTGFGAHKRIVFFDTLLKSLQPDEIEAVLAHELGHFKHGHVRKRLLLMALASLAAFAILGTLIDAEWFHTGLGVRHVSHAGALLLFLVVTPYFTAILQPLSSYWMRKHEFEADDFAAAQTGAGNLIHALVKLYEENAASLTPDKFYSAYHDSHPPAPVRISHLAEKLAAQPAS
jgi:STE24 endopeptidase